MLLQQAMKSELFLAAVHQRNHSMVRKKRMSQSSAWHVFLDCLDLSRLGVVLCDPFKGSRILPQALKWWVLPSNTNTFYCVDDLFFWTWLAVLLCHYFVCNRASLLCKCKVKIQSTLMVSPTALVCNSVGLKGLDAAWVHHWQQLAAEWSVGGWNSGNNFVLVTVS